MSAVDELRAMVDRITAFVAARGSRWEDPNAPESLLLDAAKLMAGIANGLDDASPMFELLREDDTK